MRKPEALPAAARPSTSPAEPASGVPFPSSTIAWRPLAQLDSSGGGPVTGRVALAVCGRNGCAADAAAHCICEACECAASGHDEGWQPHGDVSPHAALAHGAAHGGGAWALGPGVAPGIAPGMAPGMDH